MGDITEMILEGVLCEYCGSFLGKPVGYPRHCIDCNEEAMNETENE